MKWMSVIHQRADETLLSAARSTQAAVIESLDRTMGVGHDTRLPGGRRLSALRAQLNRWVVEEPAARLDDNYELLQRLLSLHREFIQRMFDVLDSRDSMPETESADAACQVLPFRAEKVHRR